MANNRLKLRCKVCGAEIAIAKWYPGTGWYTNRADNDSFNAWLNDHSHDTEFAFAAEYEVPPQ